MFKDYYRILGVKRLASSGEIKTAYRTLAQHWHPDRNPDAGATRQMQLINEAYLILRDPQARSRYDAEYDRFTHWRNAADADPVSRGASQREAEFADSKAVYENYSVKDDVLRNWIDEAIRTAQRLGKQAIDEASGMLADAGKFAMHYAVVSVLICALMYVMIMLSVGGCN